LKFAEYVVLFFEVIVLGSREGTMEEGSILGVDEEIKVKMVRDDGCGQGSRHE
jgi:hypothetical protein